MNAEDELLDLLALRYSVGPKYLAPPGPSAEQWTRAAELALRAPDHGGLRPFRFVVIGDSQRVALAELFATGAQQRGQAAEEVERARVCPGTSPSQGRQLPAVLEIVAVADHRHQRRGGGLPDPAEPLQLRRPGVLAGDAGDVAVVLRHALVEPVELAEQVACDQVGLPVDDAYLGGEVRGGKAGRGSPNKIPFVAAVQTTESGQPVLMCLSQRPFTKESIQAFAERSLAAPATLASDGLGCFTAVRDSGILHEPHTTGGGAASAKHPAFLAVNTALGNIKTALAGTHHAFGFRKYAHHDLGQVQYLFNRRFDLRTMKVHFPTVQLFLLCQ